MRQTGYAASAVGIWGAGLSAMFCPGMIISIEE